MNIDRHLDFELGATLLTKEEPSLQLCEKPIYAADLNEAHDIASRQTRPALEAELDDQFLQQY